MNSFYISLLGLFLVASLFFVNHKRSFDIFNLYNFYLLTALAEIPYLIFLSNNQSEIHPYVYLHLQDFDSIFQQHIIYKMLFLFTCLAAMLSFKTKSSFLQKRFDANNYKKSTYFLMFLLMLLLTLVIYISFLQKVGGLQYLIANFSNKTLVVQGTGWYRNAFLVTAMLSIGFLILRIREENHQRIDLMILFTAILFSFFLMLASIGERKNPLILLLFSVIMWHYNIKKVNILQTKYLILGLALVLFAAVAPVLRMEGATEFYLENPSLLLDAAAPHIGELFKRFSEVDISLFIYSHFQSHSDYWYGSSFKDLILGIIPSSYYENKPPLDEGVYIYALAHLYDVSPSTPFNQMLPVGWPLSRVTSGYVHFGIAGIILYGILTGIILKYVYIAMRKTKSPQAIALYSIMMLSSFGISNSFIANTLVVFVMLITFPIPLRFFRRRHSLDPR